MQEFNIYRYIVNAYCCFFTDCSLLLWLFSILILARIIFVISSIIKWYPNHKSKGLQSSYPSYRLKCWKGLGHRQKPDRFTGDLPLALPNNSQYLDRVLTLFQKLFKCFMHRISLNLHSTLTRHCCPNVPFIREAMKHKKVKQLAQVTQLESNRNRIQTCALSLQSACS